ncbi:transcriptional regulator FilR1 domain-containing protein [Methanobrevibacter sp.]|uniref:helix-turn-helix transcriptional regulator n=1 Tax=Methanobrevibacter sp. TaxID=66852 RepID=UPI002E773C92|nr:transcriptional regulator FilR1 domain-containing protein [Methanobrevibacter sp.]MEE0938881.1 transcriptional regulator FilR1 domain-containing protein [Methanobrevibacter sp.]
MTNLQTKQELNNEFKNIKYILTSTMRSKLILAMYNAPRNLEELRNELKKPSATILHGLKELETKNIINKVQKQYQLTSHGYLLATNMIKLIENWSSINNNTSFWDNHDLNDIPQELLKNMHLLKDATYITSTTSDLSNAFNKYLKLISTSSELKIILPIYSENHIKHMIELLDKNKLKYLELIISEDILKSIKSNKSFKEHLLGNKKVKIIPIKKNLKIFLTYSANFISLTLFFKDGHYDDSQILIGESEDTLKWGSKLYEKYIK